MSCAEHTLSEAARSELEHELSSYACLHISAMQLAAARDAESLLEHIAELLDQLVGVSRFGLWAVTEDARTLRALLTRGGGAQGAREVEDGVERDAIAQGRPVVAPVLDGRMHPLAAVPLCSGGKVLALLCIEALHGHKSAWAAADTQLFDVLSLVGGVTLGACMVELDATGLRARVERFAQQLNQQSNARKPAEDGPEEV